MNDRRTYFPTPRPEVVGKPTWSPCKKGEECPHCGAGLCEVTVEVKPPPMLRTASGRAKCVYLGCPACTYASPSMTSAL